MTPEETKLRQDYPRGSESFFKRQLGDKYCGLVKVEKEQDLHKDILEEIRKHGYMVFHGSMAHRTYRTPGEPDFVIFGQHPNCWLIEAKTAAGKLSTDQQAIQAWAKKLGWAVHVVRSIEEFRLTIQSQT